MDDPTRDDAAKKASERRSRRAADSLRALGSAERVRVVLLLADGERGVGEILAELSASQQAAGHHLRLLKHARLIAPRRVGRDVRYALTSKGEGLIEAFFETVEVIDENGKARKEKQQVRSNLLCLVDEGQRATRQASQSTSVAPAITFCHSTTWCAQ